MLLLSRHLTSYLLALRVLLLLLVAHDLMSSPDVHNYVFYRSLHSSPPPQGAGLDAHMWLGVLLVWNLIAAILQWVLQGPGRSAAIVLGDVALGCATVALQKLTCGGLLFVMPVITAFEAGPLLGWGTSGLLLVLYPCLAVLHTRSVAAGTQPLVVSQVGLIACAVVAGLLVEHLRRTEAQANALVGVIQVSQQLGSSSTLDKVLELVLQDTRALIETDHCAIYLRDLDNPTQAVLHLAKIASPTPHHFSDFDPTLMASVVGKVIKEGKGVLMDDFVTYEPEEVIKKQSGMRACMVAPLVFEDQPIGAILVGHLNSGVYNDALFRLFGLLCNQVALAVRNVQLQATTATLAITDSLSGLYTHGYFQDSLGKELLLHKSRDQALSLMIIDVDFFKKVNDSYGHPQGDAMLKQLGGVIKQLTRTTDVVCRYGGDEFTVTMTNTDRMGAMVLAERIRQTVEEHTFVVGNRNLKITVSGGVASYPENAESKKELIEKADKAMYESKKNGRNRVSASA
jgi:diguanylate cyclase (GGDEF)-like protein